MKKKFGHLVDGILELAPKGGKIDNIMFLSFSEEQYHELGYKEVINNELQMKSGFEVKFVGYTETDDQISLNYEYVEVKEQIKLSKLKIQIALIKLGLWDKFITWLSETMIQITDEVAITCKDAWDNALVIDSADELFAPYLEKAKEQFKEFIDEDTINSLIEKCKAE